MTRAERYERAKAERAAAYRRLLTAATVEELAVATFDATESSTQFCDDCAAVAEAQVELLTTCRSIEALTESTYGEPLDTPRREAWHRLCRRLREHATKLEGLL